eukprot:CAMPEP_0185199690 /NCGR_PEP_ID=MMETSP1140-20130426/45612_1 /TAXON_ID=298111 /ORGANISM="Pavlova sp., Strain CCMP459" /LENGTH=31 /DNA_ID= /DNA_START= /DNA_END= /DNA_ORIENTATION=
MHVVVQHVVNDGKRQAVDPRLARIPHEARAL